MSDSWGAMTSRDVRRGCWERGLSSKAVALLLKHSQEALLCTGVVPCVHALHFMSGLGDGALEQTYVCYHNIVFPEPLFR